MAGVARPHDDYGSTYRVPEHAPPGFARRHGGGTSNGLAAPAAADDAPEGFGPRGGGSLGFTLQECEFMYRAPDGNEHGPVPLAKILRWKQQNYFADDVLVRPLGPWTSVAELVARTGGAAAPAGSAAVGKPQEREGSSGGGQRQPAQQKQQHQPPQAQQQQGGEDVAAAERLFTGGASSAEQQPSWWYIDQVNKVQGPFSAADMISWFAAAYFDHSIKMASTARKGDPAPAIASFKRLGMLLSTPRQSVQQANKVIELISDEEFEQYGASTAADGSGWASGAGARGPAARGKQQGQQRAMGAGALAGGSRNAGASAAAALAPGPSTSPAAGGSAPSALYGMGGFSQQQAAAAVAAAAQLAAFNASGPGGRAVDGNMQMQMALQQLNNAQLAGMAGAAGGVAQKLDQPGRVQEVVGGMQGLLVAGAGAGAQDGNAGRSGAAQGRGALAAQQQPILGASWGSSWANQPQAGVGKAQPHDQFNGWS